MQGTRVWSLVREDPTCSGTAKPLCPNYWACTPQTHAPQEKSQKWEAYTTLSPQLQKAYGQQGRPSASKNNEYVNFLKCIISLKSQKKVITLTIIDIILCLQTRKPRLREVKWLVQGHTAGAGRVGIRTQSFRLLSLNSWSLTKLLLDVC